MNSFSFQKNLAVAILLTTFLGNTNLNAQSWTAVGEDESNQAVFQYGYNPRLVLDESDVPYLYAQDGFTSFSSLRKFVNGAWEFVGTRGFNNYGHQQYTSMAFGTNGVIYIAFSNMVNSSKATVMKYDAGSWSYVGSAQFTTGGAYYNCLAVDSNNVPYLGFVDGANGNKLTVMSFVSGSWSTVGGAAVSSGYASTPHIMFDKTGVLHAVYYDNANSNKATMKKFSGGSWSTVGSAGFTSGTAVYTQMVFDKNNEPYVVYRDGANSNKATVMTYSGGSWSVVGGSGLSAGAASETSIGIDSSGTVYVGYKDETMNKATVRKYSGGSWNTVGTAGFSQTTLSFKDLGVTKGGKPYILYSEQHTEPKAFVMAFNGSSWDYVGTKGINLTQTKYPKIEIDTVNNIPYVAYSDGDSGYKATVKKWTGSSWSLLGNQGFTSGVANFISLAVDGNSDPYVAFQDVSNANKLTVMKYSGGNWSVVGSPGLSTGKASYISMAIDQSGDILVAYQDNGLGNKACLQKYSSGSWQLVGGGPLSSGSTYYTALTLDQSGDIYVGYTDSSAGSSVTVKKYSGGSWSLVGSAGFSGSAAYQHVMDVDPSGNPVIFFQSYAGKPRVMKFSSGAWTNVDSTSLVAQSSYAVNGSMDIDKAGNIYLSTNNGENHLAVIKYDGNTWSKPGYSGNLSGGYISATSIKTDNSGSVYVMWQDGSSWVKKYASTCTSPAISNHPVSLSKCEGDSAKFSCLATGTSISFQWQDSTSSHTWANVSGAVDSTYTIYNLTAAASGNKYRCMVNNSCGNLSSSSANLNVNPLVTPSISITTPDDTVCTGIAINFTANPVNGGTSPTYTWKKNNTTIGSNLSYIDVYTLTNGDTIRCIMTSSANCASSTTSISNDLTLVVNNCGPIATCVASGLWRDAATWNTNTVPSGTTNVILQGGRNVVINAAASCKNLSIGANDTLTILNGGDLTVNGNFVIDGTLTFHGLLNMVGGRITFTKPKTCIPGTGATYHIMYLKTNTPDTIFLCEDILVKHTLRTFSGTVLESNGHIAELKGANLINNGSITGSGKVLLSSSTGSNITGTGDFGNVEVNGGNVSFYNSTTINGTLTLTSGNVILQAGNILTLGNTSSNTGNVVCKSGSLSTVSSSGITQIKILGNSAAPRIDSIKLNTVMNLYIDRPAGVSLGMNALVRKRLDLINGNIDINGFNLNLGQITTANIDVNTSGGIVTNSSSSGWLYLLGNSSAASQTIRMDSMANCNVKLPQGLNLGSEVYIRSVFSIGSGFVDLNDYTITLGPSASVTEVAGNTFRGSAGTIMTTRLFTTPLSLLNIGGMGGRFGTNAAPGLTTVSRGHGVHTSGSGHSINRWFGFKSDTSLTVALEFNYDSTELSGADRSKLRMSKGNYIGTNWIALVGGTRSTANNATGYVYRTNIQTDSIGSLFTVSDSVNSPLSPLMNTLHPKTGANPQIEDVEFNMPIIATQPIIVSPNPFLSNLQIDFGSNTKDLTVVSLCDLSGRILFTQTITPLEGSNKVMVNTENLAYGMYIVKIGETTLKVIKQ